ncbi:MAG TPA: AraC family transcriptional regulator [Burkholderiaceae bacterium]|nr:AraC family transcriptional regulator [Burkholderiaceae bacterium]
MPAAVTRHTVSIAQVHWILQGARRKGVDVGKVLRRAGISAALFDAPLARVSQQQYAALIRALRRVMRDEFFGLIERPVPVGTFAQCCGLLIHTRTLGEALRTGLAFYHRVIDDFVGRLQINSDIARVRIFTRPGTRLPLDDCASYAQRVFMFLGYGLACWLVARPIPLLGVEYNAPTPNAASDAHRLFDAPLHYGQEHTGLWFEAQWLQLPVVQNPQSLAEYLQRAPMDLLVRFRDRTTVTERIRRLLRRHLNEEMPSLEEVGRTLAMTPQTLRRRLHEEGQGYQQLKDDLRRDAAIEYLTRPELTLMDIATRLGFSEPSTFHRAFKKWTGVAPGEYRNTVIRDHP